MATRSSGDIRSRSASMTTAALVRVDLAGGQWTVGTTTGMLWLVGLGSGAEETGTFSSSMKQEKSTKCRSHDVDIVGEVEFCRHKAGLLNTVITTMVIRPLDDPTRYAQSVVADLQPLGLVYVEVGDGRIR